MEGSAAWGPGTAGSTAVGVCSTCARAGRWGGSIMSSSRLAGSLCTRHVELCAPLLQQAAAK